MKKLLLFGYGCQYLGFWNRQIGYPALITSWQVEWAKHDKLLLLLQNPALAFLADTA